jgi:aldehyde:ferredoxin oxidoreductase
MYGWSGKILDVDLTTETVSVKNLELEVGRQFLGSRGVNAYLLWDALREPGVDPLGPENVFIIGAGTLSGTLAPCSGRTTATCKGVMWEGYLKGNMGGHFGAMLKFAGYDHVIVRGRAKGPRFLWINDEEVAIRDASGYWGLDIYETDEALRRDTDQDVETVCIGPAGENLVKYAIVSGSVNNPAARGGLGAVMGSKNLKGIAVMGSGSVEVAHPESLYDLALKWRQRIEGCDETETLYSFGTSGHLLDAAAAGHLLRRNFSEAGADLEKVKQLTGQALVEKGYLKRRVSCTSCDISCHRFTKVDSGPFEGTFTGGPEFESFTNLGLGVDVYDTEAVIKAHELCNRLGLDLISTGVTVQWAMESFERGVLSKGDYDGIELRFGEADDLHRAIEMIARREGELGQLLAEGSKRAAQQVGQNSIEWAMCNSKGLEQSGGDLRGKQAYALAFAVNPRGCDHLHAQPWAEYALTHEARDLMLDLTGKDSPPYAPTEVAKIVRWHEDTYAVLDSLGLCIQPIITAYVIGPRDMAEMFSLATGIRCDEEGIMTAGRRILTLEKCFNTQEGADRCHDDLPWKTMNIPAPGGPAQGSRYSGDMLDEMLDVYYDLHGWDLATSWPCIETLEQLGLDEAADRLAAQGKLK